MPRRMRSALMRPPIPSNDGPIGGPAPSIAWQPRQACCVSSWRGSVVPPAAGPAPAAAVAAAPPAAPAASPAPPARSSAVTVTSPPCDCRYATTAQIWSPVSCVVMTGMMFWKPGTNESPGVIGQQVGSSRPQPVTRGADLVVELLARGDQVSRARAGAQAHRRRYLGLQLRDDVRDRGVEPDHAEGNSQDGEVGAPHGSVSPPPAAASPWRARPGRPARR